ncbi:DNA damage-regulated autophagy modulator protein 1, partial [Stegodyphus mimosarum]
MAQHSWQHLDRLPYIFGVVFITGILLPVTIALICERVTPYVPYISEGGGNFPEAGIFGIFIVISSYLSLNIMFLRYLVVEEMAAKVGNGLDVFLNKVSFILGFLSTFALIVVACFPTATVTQVHNTAAGIVCTCIVLYMNFHSWISLRMPSNKKVENIRLTITLCSSLAIVIIAIFGVLGSSQWTAEYWAGSKTPKDDGFVSYLVSASAEWILAVMFFLYLATYIPEFKNSSLELKLKLNIENRSTPRITVVKA